jgi:outer membrane lipoprotein-sorting protein
MTSQELYSDGKTLWTYLKDANEVQISNVDDLDSEINPSNIFTIYKKGFEHRFGGTKTIDGNEVNIVELTPTDKSKSYFKIKISVEKKTNKIKSMTIFSKNGIELTYKINALTPNVDYKDDFFKFNSRQKPGVIEIDLR